MKKVLLLLLLLISFAGFSQDFEKNWKKVYEYEYEGKVKLASKEVDKIYKKARKNANQPEIIRTFIYQSKFLQILEENAQYKIIENLKKEIKSTNIGSKSIFNNLYATFLSDYFSKFRYNLRTNTDTIFNPDFRTWSKKDFEVEIENAYLKSIENETFLLKTPLLNYEKIIEFNKYEKELNSSLYDFLAEKYIKRIENSVGMYEEGNLYLEQNISQLYGKSSEFQKLDFSKLVKSNFYTKLSIYQKLEKQYFEDDNKVALAHTILKRISTIYSVRLNPEEFIASLTRFSKEFQNQNNTAYLMKLAFVYNDNASKSTKQDYRIKALALSNEIIATKKEPFLSEATSLKQSILQKKFNFKAEKYLIPNQKNLALVSYTNVDTIYGRIYKIPNEMSLLSDDENYYYSGDQKSKRHIDRDSLFEYIKKHKPLKSFTNILPNKSDYFEYSTEIIYPELESGTYLMFINLEKDSISLKSNYAFAIISSSDLLINTKSLDKEEEIQVLNRKTGKPIKNAFVKFEDKIAKTNDNGTVTILNNNSDRYKKIQVTYQKDSLSHYYYSYNYNYKKSQDSEKEKFDAKVNFYTDRAIYRPGQTVYFKGILTQSNGKITSVTPDVYVNVILKDANDKEISKSRLKSNEFGSFTGEFILPKNTLTGTFKIIADEDEDYIDDSFWDKLDDFQISEITFNVEEYKRPKFEITFEPIKENFIVNQQIKIKGKAKSFAGSNISDAKVVFKVTRSSQYKNLNFYNSYSDYNYEQIINGETKTDNDGNFEIEFTASPAPNFDEKGLPIFNFSITAEVTDINGETQKKATEAKVGYHSLNLTTEIENWITTNTQEITFDSQNLNDQFVATKGELKIYKLKSPDRILKDRSWKAPEIQTISETEFKKLFPNEPYTDENISANWENGELAFSEKVNTGISKKVTLKNLKNWKSGKYRLYFTAKDTFGKSIEEVTLFNIEKDEDNKLSDNQLFEFEIQNQNPKKDGFIEILFSSATPQLFVTTEAFYQSKLFSNTITEVNGKKIIKIPIDKNSINDIKLSINYVWQNQYFQKNKTIYLPEIIENLSIETISMRNKIEPGSNESWSFSIKNKNDKNKTFEVLSSMYDASLDEFAKAYWPTNLNFNKSIYNSISTKTFHGLEKLDLYSQNLNRINYQKNSQPNSINWFGFDFANPNQNSHEYRKFLTEQLVISKGLLVKGIVTDKNLPLSGVKIRVSGTERETITDNNGHYEIKALLGEIIEFNFTGLQEHFGFVNGDAINIKMDEKPFSLDEIVVTGELGLKRKSSSVTSSYIVSKTLLDGTASEVKLDAEIIEEDVNKVFYSSAKGLATKSAKIQIRGVDSLENSNKALYVIDGTEITAEDFQKLNANDIQNITVLKNTTAVSLYGNRAKDGVIVIVTKKAIAELLKVKARKNLSETAFFLPQLKTDKNGNLSFSFASPEALTKWKLRIFAHNKKAISGYHESLIITQKDLMVIPNLPRFLREKDTITITTKIANMTPEAKSGIALLQLFDAVSMEPIDAKMLNLNTTKPFQISSKGNTSVSWKIYVPEGLQGVQYKIVAKAGDFSDGEENILPVLTNNMLVTESIPVWVRENSTKEYTFENLKNNSSSTLRNQQLTFEYTSNPTWLAIQSLPYLMEYEHECAEQTFARYYANALASEILNSNPKIAEVFESWKKSDKPVSKLQQNEELKSILLAETPWIADAENEEQKKKNLALLFDLQKMKDSQEAILNKLALKQKPSGGFAWFENGEESEYITRHIISGLGHLQHLSKNATGDFDAITKKGVDFLDQKFLDNYILNEAKDNQQKLVWINPYNNLHYLYARSFYLDNQVMGKNLLNVSMKYIEEIKKNWMNYSLYEKGLASLVLSRFGEKESAEKILESLRQTASNNEDWGMYWIENKSGWYWYQAPIETQALLIEAFAEIGNDKKSVEAMKVWLLKNKQNKNWPTTKATTEAVYALLMQGNDWISIKDKTVIKLGNEKILTKKLSENEKEAGTGYIKMNWKTDEISKEMATVFVNNKSDVPGFGGFYWQYFEDLDKIKSSQESPMKVEKELYLKATTSEGDELQRITISKPLKIGDLVTVRLVISTKEDMEFVHLKDMRASCFEPIDVISGYNWKDGLGFYKSTKDVATHFFFDLIKKGTYVLEYDIRVNNLGDFSNGITTIQSMYAPEFSSHTKGIRVKVKE